MSLTNERVLMPTDSTNVCAVNGRPFKTLPGMRLASLDARLAHQYEGGNN